LTFLRSYLFPVVLLIVLTAITSFLGLLYFCFWIFVAGATKRMHDVNLKFGRGAKFGVGFIWIISAIVAAAIAFVLFLGGISGLGNSGMIEDAALILIAPIVLPVLLIILIAFVAPGSTDANEYGPVPTSSTMTAAARKNTKAILKLTLVTAAIAITGAAFFASYIYLSERETALIQALQDRDASEVKAQLNKGADPNKPARSGMTPLMSALSTDLDESATLLLEHGANPSTNSINRNYYGNVDFKQTPLVAAIRYTSGDASALIELMLDKGADVNPLPASEHEKSPLLEAIESQQYAVVELFLERGADLNAASNQDALATAVSLIDDRYTELLLTGNIGQEQIDAIIQWIDSSLITDGCQRFLPAKREILITAVNDRAGTEVYAPSEYFLPDSEVYDPMNFTQLDFKRPIAAITDQSRYNPRFVRVGPGMEYGKVTSLEKDTLVDVLAMTDSSKFGYRWFQIRYDKDQTGYMLGSALWSKTICIEGMKQL
jgi:ankyrin repeat protein/uncharacterized membrane protein YhaH (DUF805 family)